MTGHNIWDSVQKAMLPYIALGGYYIVTIDSPMYSCDFIFKRRLISNVKLSKEIGKQRTVELFVKAGTLAGVEFCRNVLDKSMPFAEFIAREVDCWATGDRTCRFSVKPVEN